MVRRGQFENSLHIAPRVAWQQTRSRVNRHHQWGCPVRRATAMKSLAGHRSVYARGLPAGGSRYGPASFRKFSVDQLPAPADCCMSSVPLSPQELDRALPFSEG